MRSQTMLYSTNERLVRVLSQSITYSYAASVYHDGNPLFLNKIRDDLRYELSSIQQSPIRTMSNYQYVLPDSAMDLTENLLEVCNLCRFLIGDIEVPPSDDPIKYIRDNMAFDRYATRKFSTTWVRYCIARAHTFSGNDAEVIVEDGVPIPALRREGFCLYLTVSSHFTGRFEFDSTKVEVAKGPVEFTNFLSCLSFTNGSIDTYLMALANVCYERDPNMFGRGMRSVSSKTEWTLWIQKVYGNDGIRRVVRDITYGQDLLRQSMRHSIVSVHLGVITRLVDAQRVSLGRQTTEVLSLMDAEALFSSDTRRAAVNYLRGVLLSPEKAEESKDVEVRAYQANEELYVACLDVTSDLYHAMEADEDEILDEENDEPEEDLVEDDDGDKENTLVLSLPAEEDTLAINVYLWQISSLITQILKNPPEAISSEDLMILKELKVYWLYLIDPKQTHALVTGIVDLPTKVDE